MTRRQLELFESPRMFRDRPKNRRAKADPIFGHKSCFINENGTRSPRPIIIIKKRMNANWKCSFLILNFHFGGGKFSNSSFSMENGEQQQQNIWCKWCHVNVKAARSVNETQMWNESFAGLINVAPFPFNRRHRLHVIYLMFSRTYTQTRSNSRGRWITAAMCSGAKQRNRCCMCVGNDFIYFFLSLTRSHNICSRLHTLRWTRTVWMHAAGAMAKAMLAVGREWRAQCWMCQDNNICSM